MKKPKIKYSNNYNGFFSKYSPGAIVKLKSNCGFSPAGVYKVSAVFDKLLCLQAGDIFFGIGDIFANQLELIEDENIELTNQKTLEEYAKMVIRQLEIINLNSLEESNI